MKRAEDVRGSIGVIVGSIGKFACSAWQIALPCAG
jgi:hypothetical protein